MENNGLNTIVMQDGTGSMPLKMLACKMLFDLF